MANAGVQKRIVTRRDGNGTMSDTELELLAFLGSDFGASVVAEIGQVAVSQIFIAGAKAQHGITAQVCIDHVSAMEREASA